MLVTSNKKRSSFSGFAGIFRKIAVTLITGAFFAASAAYAAKPAGIVIDANSGKVLYNQDSGGLRFPASLTKMMTLYLVFEALNSGRISKSTPITMTPTAAAQAPTKLGVKAGGTFTVEEGILALITRSANDVAWAFAESLGGSVPNFGRMMTAKARAIGMRSTIYVNPNGLPDDRQVTTARDQAMLGVALRQHFPQYYSYFSVRSFRYGRQVIGNHNKLLGRVRGVDGIKTGYTRAAGFNLATSAQADGHSIVVVVLGERSGGGRDARVAELVKRYLPESSTGRDSFAIAKSAPTSFQAPAASPVVAFAAPQAPAVPAERYQPTADRNEVASAATSDSLPDVGPAQAPRYAQNRIDQAFGDAAAPVEAASRRDAIATPAKMAAESPPKLSEKARKAEKIAKAEDDPSEDVDRVTTASTTAKSKGWIVQVGAAPSKEQAKLLLDKAQAKGGKVLRSADPYTVAAVADGAKVYRARFGGFRGQDSAVNACKALKRRGVGCWASLD
jgi:D-alanyl-D-alanine carboxypeptidase